MGELSGTYDFDAPMFVDFTQTEQSVTDSEADKWFGKNQKNLVIFCA